MKRGRGRPPKAMNFNHEFLKQDSPKMENPYEAFPQ